MYSSIVTVHYCYIVIIRTLRFGMLQKMMRHFELGTKMKKIVLKKSLKIVIDMKL